MVELDCPYSLSLDDDSPWILLYETRKWCRRLLQRWWTHTLVGGRHQHLCHNAFCHHLYGVSRKSLCHQLDLLSNAGHHFARLFPRYSLLSALLPQIKCHLCLRILRTSIQRASSSDGFCLVHYFHGGANGTCFISSLASSNRSNGHRHIYMYSTYGAHYNCLLHHGWC